MFLHFPHYSTLVIHTTRSSICAVTERGCFASCSLICVSTYPRDLSARSKLFPGGYFCHPDCGLGVLCVFSGQNRRTQLSYNLTVLLAHMSTLPPYLVLWKFHAVPIPGVVKVSLINYDGIGHLLRSWTSFASWPGLLGGTYIAGKCTCLAIEAMDLVTCSICFGVIILAEVISIYIGSSLVGFNRTNGLSSIKCNLFALPDFVSEFLLLSPSISLLPFRIFLISYFPFLIPHPTSGLSSRLLTVSFFFKVFFEKINFFHFHSPPHNSQKNVVLRLPF